MSFATEHCSFTNFKNFFLEFFFVITWSESNIWHNLFTSSLHNCTRIRSKSRASRLYWSRAVTNFMFCATYVFSNQFELCVIVFYTALLYNHDICFVRKLRHPNLLLLMGYLRKQDTLLIITPFVRGSNLEQLIFSKEPPFQVWRLLV